MTISSLVKIRKYFRQPLVQAAQLRFVGNVEMPCEIRNFCQAGLLVKLTGQGGRDEALFQEQAEAVVAFVSMRRGEHYSMAGRLAHVANGSGGFVFDGVPPFQFLQALQEKATTNPIVDGKLSVAQAEILNQCLHALRQALSPLLDSLPPRIAADLSRQNGKAAAVDSRPAVENFFAHAQAQASSFVVPDLSLQPEAGAVYAESQAQRLLFEDWMNLIDKVIRLESKHLSVLGILEARFSVLAAKEIASHDNPFGPNVLCHAFRYALHGIRLDNSQRNLAYEAFAELLDVQLRKLYAELKVVTHSLKGKKTFATPHTHDLADLAGLPAAAAAPAAAANASSGLFAAAVSAARQKRANAANAAAVETMPLRWVTADDPDGIALLHPAAAPVAAPRSAPPPAPDAFAAFVILTRYVESSLNRNKSSEASSGYAAAKMVDALRSVQRRQAPNTYFSAYALQTALTETLAKTGDDAWFGCNAVQENLLIVGMLLDAMLANIATPACALPYIRKLQMPLFIAAFADPDVLHAPNHPARDMLNQLDYLPLATNLQGELDNPSMLTALDAIFGRMLTDVADNPQAFSEAFAALESLMQPLAKTYAMRLDRIIEACEGGQRLERARQRADDEINARIAGKTAPALLIALLDAGWRQLLVLRYLRGEDWQAPLALLDQLLAWLPQPTLPTLAQSRALKDHVRDGLVSVNADPVETKRISDLLDKLLPNDGSRPSVPEFVEVPPIDRAQLELEQACRARLAGFQVGDWLKFLSVPNVWVALRLAWVGQEPPRYVFTNRKGIKALDLDAISFVEHLDDKRTARIESLDGQPLVERVAKYLLSSLRDRLR